MDLIQVIILSLVEGLTEFLPISSTGHLILVSRALRLESSDFLKTFEIVIQLGAIMAIVVLYFKKFLTSLDIYKKLAIAFLPTAIIGILLYPMIKNLFFENTNITVISLFLGGIFLLFFEKLHKYKVHSTEYLGKYLLIGLFQSISVIPGVSRAGATIVGGMIMGLNRKSATEFSFLLAVPTMLAASGYDLYKSRYILVNSNISMLALGTFLSFLFALVAVKFLVKYVQNHDFKIFGVYRIILAILFLLFGGR